MKNKATTANAERRKAHAKTGNTAVPPQLSPLFERVLAVTGNGTGVPLSNARSGFKAHCENQPHSLVAGSSNAFSCTQSTSSSTESNFPGQTSKQKSKKSIFCFNKVLH